MAKYNKVSLNYKFFPAHWGSLWPHCTDDDAAAVAVAVVLALIPILSFFHTRTLILILTRFGLLLSEYAMRCDVMR